ncbi:MAG: L-lactate dehydrogenase (quinone) large subunit LdhH [Desulfovibrionaceae bacterium]
MQQAKDLKTYREELGEAIDNTFLHNTMDKFARAYPQGRENAFTGLDPQALIAEVVESKDSAIGRMEELYQEFKKNAEAAGVQVHLARTAAEATDIITRIAREEGCSRVVKSKSMTAEEVRLSRHLAGEGMDITEADLGEWIIQLRHEGPSHMVLPAIHLSRDQVAELFSEVTGALQSNDIEKLVKVARRELRVKFAEGDMGVSGANFCLADSGTIGFVTNEGNARLLTTLPRVHVALMGLDKVVPNLHEALKVLRVLPRNATGQAITSYVTWIHGPVECKAARNDRKIFHIVFLDNGRTTLAKDPLFSQILRCVRCGACANVCPVFRMVGGHHFGHIYVGAIGLIFTYFFHGRDNAKNLVKNCINCQACKSVCAAGIDLPRLIKTLVARIQDQEGHELDSRLLSLAMSNRRFFHGLLRSARFAQKAFGVKTSDGGKARFVRHLPMLLSKEHRFREIPRMADTPFRDKFPKLREKVDHPRFTVALFGGCAQDFMFPEHLEAGLETFRGRQTDVRYPMSQTCCGLPLMMMGETAAELQTAKQNIKAFDPATLDNIVTLCPSCASHLKNYPHLFENDPEWRLMAERFAEKIIDYSSFMHDKLGVGAEDFEQGGPRAAYHAPCHLCRGLGVHDAPRELLRTGGYDYVEMQEEEVCCGFGGSYSVKFPRISEQILKNKLDHIREADPSVLVTDCPGCVMQIRGGLAKHESNVRVRHMSEALAERLREK